MFILIQSAIKQVLNNIIQIFLVKKYTRNAIEYERNNNLKTGGYKFKREISLFVFASSSYFLIQLFEGPDFIYKVQLKIYRYESVKTDIVNVL